MSKKNKRLDQVPSTFHITCDDASVELEAAAGEESKLRRFNMTAYTGGAMRLEGWRYPVVVDLGGLRVSKKSRPILKNHSRELIVGHTDDINVSESRLEVNGVVSGVGATAQEIIATSDNGFPWQSSLGASADKVVFIGEGKSAKANGREFEGPVYVARKSTLGEVSFVALGADDDTSALVAAQTGQNLEVMTMEFEQWADEQGFNLDELDEGNLNSLRAMFDQAQTEPVEEPVTVENELPDLAAQMRREVVIESKRIADIRKLCGGKFDDIEARSIEEGWDKTQTELAILRADRPKGPAIHVAPQLTEDVLEAAACLSLGFDDTELAKQYGERVLEAAYPMRHIGLKELVAECARLEGIAVPRVFGDGRATIQAGFSTMSLPGILENVMNKTLLEAYQSVPIVAFELCSVGSVSDFKEVSRYRLLGTGGFEQIAPDGELKHGKLGEEKYKNKAETYGQILMLTRQDIINDDLNAFVEITRQMGRSGAELIDDLFFRLLLANTGNFFSAGNGNLLTGAATAFGPDALTQAKTQFRKHKVGPGTKAKDKKPINIRPEKLVVPVEVETDAELLMGAAQLMVDASGTPTKLPTDNPHRKKFLVVSAPHLSDTYYPGASCKAWYLWANPRILPAFEIVFLNGRRTPVIERVEAAPNTLGMGFRSYLDVGLQNQNPLGALKVTGE